MGMTAAERWRRDLGAWAIPEPILAAAPESPWGFPVAMFARRADRRASVTTPSTQRALEALPAGGSVLDVGCGAGAASLPLTARAAHLAGVDSSADMLHAFRERVEASGAVATTIAGAWPDVAEQTPVADVVVCHHVVYNVPDLAPFAQRLTDHARRRVVVELPVRHPLSPENDLWLHFHGVVRPTTPTVDDAIAVLREIGLAPGQERWTAPEKGRAAMFGGREELVAWVRRSLCLPATRDREIDALLGDRLVAGEDGWSFTPQPVVTLWWSGTAA